MPVATEAAPKKEKVEKVKEDPKVAVPRLIKQLESTEDQTEKRKLRSRLRNLGHYGGALRKDDGLTKAAKEPKTPVPAKGKRAAV